jgi:hypothetical protein
MNKAILILIGAVIGCFMTLLLLFIIGQVSANADNYNIQYIEVTGKNGPATLHNYMSKDSVQILLGKPDEADMHTLPMGTVREEWEYRPQNGRLLKIEFENGMLTNVNQY